MRLLHYSDKKFTLETRNYDIERFRVMPSKPSGFWVSVEGKNDWKSWCEAVEFRLEHLAYVYEVKLKEKANILYLNTEEEVLEFTAQYPLKTRDWDAEWDTYGLQWEKVKEKYQGIIISPYQWKCRLSPKSNWYYGWDCASGCIWDLDCIEEFNLIKSHESKESHEKSFCTA